MASSCTFSLAVPILVSLYRGLNGIAHATKPFDSWEGKVSDLGCLMLAKNCPNNISDNEKLYGARSDYFVSLRDGFLPIRHGASFHMELYSPIG